MIPVRRRSRRPAGNDRGDDQGETLIELMVAVLIMGTAVIAVVASLLTATITATKQRKMVRAGNEASTIVELIQTAAYIDCVGGASPYSAAYSGANYALPTGYTLTVSPARYLADRTSASLTFQSGCPSPDQGLQEITVTVKPVGAGSNSTRSEQVVLIKRRSA